MAAKDDLGRAGEERAARHLTDTGYTVLDRNWRCRDGELDIVALHGDALVAVEVKTRRGEGYGHPFEAIRADKRQRLARLIVAWAVAHPDLARGRRLRVDAIAVIGADPSRARLEHLRDVR